METKQETRGRKRIIAGTEVLTIDGWRGKYEVYQRLLVRERTYELYYGALKKFFSRFKDKRYVEEITASDVEEFKIAMLREGRKARYVNLILNIVSGFYQFIQNVHEHKCVNPVTRVRRLRTAEVEHTPCGSTELEKLLAVAEEPLDRLLVALGSTTGLRGEEMALLDWADIDFENRVLNLPASKAKGKQKSRHLPLHDDVVTLLKEVQALGTATVFGRYGRSREGLYYRLRLLSNKAGVQVTPHALRRSFATLLMRSGVDLKSVQLCLGHSNIATTSRYLQGSETEEIREKLNLINLKEKHRS